MGDFSMVLMMFRFGVYLLYVLVVYVLVSLLLE